MYFCSFPCWGWYSPSAHAGADSWPLQGVPGVPGVPGVQLQLLSDGTDGTDGTCCLSRLHCRWPPKPPCLCHSKPGTGALPDWVAHQAATVMGRSITKTTHMWGWFLIALLTSNKFRYLGRRILRSTKWFTEWWSEAPSEVDEPRACHTPEHCRAVESLCWSLRSKNGKNCSGVYQM